MSTQNHLYSSDLKEYMEKNSIPGKIETLGSNTKTVVQAASVLGVSPQQIIKSLLFIIADEPVILISAGTALIDKKAVRKHFKVSKRQLRLAKPEEMVEITGYSVGTMPPLGHKTKLRTIIDPSVMEYPSVYGGGGDTMAMVKIRSEILLEHANAEIMDISL